jgi:hypothetical protein
LLLSVEFFARDRARGVLLTAACPFECRRGIPSSLVFSSFFLLVSFYLLTLLAFLLIVSATKRGEGAAALLQLFLHHASNECGLTQQPRATYKGASLIDAYRAPTGSLLSPSQFYA